MRRGYGESTEYESKPPICPFFVRDGSVCGVDGSTCLRPTNYDTCVTYQMAMMNKVDVV